MKRKLDPRLKLCRIKHPHSDDPGDDQHGAFCIKASSGRYLYILISAGMGWDHVSVSLRDSHDTPTWDEMCWVKDLLFEPEEIAIQYHPPHSRYVNIEAGCLHLWRPQTIRVPMPPLIMV